MTQTLGERVESALEATQRRTKDTEESFGRSLERHRLWAADVPDAPSVAKLLKHMEKTTARTKQLSIAVPGTDFDAYDKAWILGRNIRQHPNGSVDCFLSCLDPAEEHMTSEDLRKQAEEISQAEIDDYVIDL